MNRNYCRNSTSIVHQKGRHVPPTRAHASYKLLPNQYCVYKWSTCSLHIPATNQSVSPTYRKLRPTETIIERRRRSRCHVGVGTSDRTETRERAHPDGKTNLSFQNPHRTDRPRSSHPHPQLLPASCYSRASAIRPSARHNSNSTASLHSAPCLHKATHLYVKISPYLFRPKPLSLLRIDAHEIVGVLLEGLVRGGAAAEHRLAHVREPVSARIVQIGRAHV